MFISYVPSGGRALDIEYIIEYQTEQNIKQKTKQNLDLDLDFRLENMENRKQEEQRTES